MGWLNTFVPGGGELLRGNGWSAASQAALEISAFGWGYSLSPRRPMTLDGVPESIPSIPSNAFLPRTRRHGRASLKTDISRELYADWLQEIGLKAHMVNVYNAYRAAGAPRTDPSTNLQLFLKPFESKTLLDPWVYSALSVSLLAVLADYLSTVHAGVAKHARLVARSNVLYGVTYLGVFPIGSAAPEEMFYRGFLQNEAFAAVGSPYFSIPASAAAYALSHESGVDQVAAAVTGLYLGFLVHKDEGRLGSAIAFHFWSDVLAGAEALALLLQGQPGSRTVSTQFSLAF